MASPRSFKCVSLILLVLVVSQAFILPALASTHAEKKLVETAQTISSEKESSDQDYRGFLPGGVGAGRGVGGAPAVGTPKRGSGNPTPRNPGQGVGGGNSPRGGNP